MKSILVFLAKKACLRQIIEIHNFNFDTVVSSFLETLKSVLERPSSQNDATVTFIRYKKQNYV